MIRPTWDEYFMKLAELIKTRSTCLRRQVGALVVQDKRIVSTGYNGAPKWCRHCDELGCMRQKLNVPSGEKHELGRAVHAEQNAILQAAYYGVSVSGATVYTTTQPCIMCAKSMINAGIKRVVFKGDYPDNMSLDMLREACVELIKLEETEET